MHALNQKIQRTKQMKTQSLMYGPQFICKDHELQKSVPLLRRRASLRVGNA